MLCMIDGCKNTDYSRGVCRNCYVILRKSGVPWVKLEAAGVSKPVALNRVLAEVKFRRASKVIYTFSITFACSVCSKQKLLGSTGLCSVCYAFSRKLIRAGETTKEELVYLGLIPITSKMLVEAALKNLLRSEDDG